MTDLGALLEACHANLDDATPWLALCDCLDETNPDEGARLRYRLHLRRCHSAPGESYYLEELARYYRESRPVPDWEDREAIILNARDLNMLLDDEFTFLADDVKGRTAHRVKSAIDAILRRHTGPCETCNDRKVVLLENIKGGPAAAYERCPTCVLATRIRWDRCPCPTCEGKGSLRISRGGGGYDDHPCPTCGGSGDLLRRPDGTWREPTFPRGLPVVGATLEEMVREEECPGDHSTDAESECEECNGTGRVHKPTPWLLALLEAMPEVGVTVEGVEPRHVSDSLGEGWTIPRREGRLIYDELTAPMEPRGYKRWTTPTEARAALDAAMNQWIERFWKMSYTVEG